jgi:ATP-dependent helicase/nuclease subunit B
VREGYLEWLAGHEATGATFDEAEVWREMPLGELTLLGKLDRIDRQADGHALLVDYKTEPRATTAERIKNGQEDTQLAFYAALMSDDTLAAAYVNLGEKEPTKTYEQVRDRGPARRTDRQHPDRHGTHRARRGVAGAGRRQGL